MRLAYIAGPYRADTAEGIAENVRRAVNLSRWAVRRGLAPQCIHAEIAAGALGDDADPAERANGINIATARAANVSCVGGAILIIRRDDGSMSSGTHAERNAFVASMNHGAEIIEHTWAEWVAAGVDA